MKLGENLLILVIIESHDVRQIEPVIDSYHFVKLRLILLLHPILINILHLDDLGLLGCKNGSDIKVRMKLILESIVNA
jgi:hypothetical protein